MLIFAKEVNINCVIPAGPRDSRSENDFARSLLRPRRVYADGLPGPPEDQRYSILLSINFRYRTGSNLKKQCCGTGSGYETLGTQPVIN
jgi:hypothetical protein